MDQITQYIQRIPKLLLGTIIIVGSLIFLVYNDPPTTICDIQMEEVNKKLIGKFYSNKDLGRMNAQGFVVGGSATGTYQKDVMSAFDSCMKSNSPGGCFDMFARLKYLEKQVRTIPGECGGHVKTLPIRQALEKGLKLFVKLAWGEKPPESKYDKTSWLDTTDIVLFCLMQEQHKRVFGKRAWAQFRTGVMKTLPEAETLDKKKLWEKSLLSYPCRRLF